MLKKVSIEALANAEQYVKDANTLMKVKSYAHGFCVLAVLADEEISKSYLCLSFWLFDIPMNRKMYREFFLSHKNKLSLLQFNIFWVTSSKVFNKYVERKGIPLSREHALESLRKPLQIAESQSKQGREMREELDSISKFTR